MSVSSHILAACGSGITCVTQRGNDESAYRCKFPRTDAESTPNRTNATIYPASFATPAPQLIQALAQAAKSGKFTVSLSQGKPHTLYVFSDPLCPHCRAFKPTLERLAADYNIEVFPVSLVGDDAQIAKSGIINQFVLTAEKNERIQRWKKVMMGEVSAANDAPQSQEMAERVNANNQAFGLLGFTGTPSVMTEDGKEISLDVAKNPLQLAGYFNN